LSFHTNCSNNQLANAIAIYLEARKGISRFNDYYAQPPLPEEGRVILFMRTRKGYNRKIFTGALKPGFFGKGGYPAKEVVTLQDGTKVHVYMRKINRASKYIKAHIIEHKEAYEVNKKNKAEFFYYYNELTIIYPPERPIEIQQIPQVTEEESIIIYEDIEQILQNPDYICPFGKSN